MTSTLVERATTLTSNELSAIVVTTRVTSVLSLIGCAFIITTFLTSTAFHKPINRLVFYASVGNLMECVATLITTAALKDINGPLCQFQGFLIQMYVWASSPSPPTIP